MTNTFVSAEKLQDKILAREPINIVDCRYYLTDPTQGLMEYLEGHLPKAVYADLNEDLSSPITSNSGRHPLPDLPTFKYWLANNGLHPKQEVYVYDNQGGGYAARLWFMLNQLGYKVWVLEGGITRFAALGYSLSSGREVHSSVDERELEKLPKDWNDGDFEMVDVQQIENTMQVPDVILVDSRAPERYAGLTEPYDTVAGRIPTAVNLYWKSNLDENQNLLPQEDLEKNFGFGDKKRIFYCGSGVSACFNLLVNEHIGNKKGAVYIGSFSEWIKLKPNNIEKD